MSKVLKCAANDDAITIKADDSPDSVTFMFESPSKYFVTKIRTKAHEFSFTE